MEFIRWRLIICNFFCCSHLHLPRKSAPPIKVWQNWISFYSSTSLKSLLVWMWFRHLARLWGVGNNDRGQCRRQRRLTTIYGEPNFPFLNINNCHINFICPEEINVSPWKSPSFLSSSISSPSSYLFLYTFGIGNFTAQIWLIN